MRALTVERIGTCELCGLTDHHLVDGVCPTCRPRCATIPATAPGVALPPPSLELSVSGNSGFIARSREAFAQLGAAARLAFSNLDMPDDEALGDEAGAPREVGR